MSIEEGGDWNGVLAEMQEEFKAQGQTQSMEVWALLLGQDSYCTQPDLANIETYLPPLPPSGEPDRDFAAVDFRITAKQYPDHVPVDGAGSRGHRPAARDTAATVPSDRREWRRVESG